MGRLHQRPAIQSQPDQAASWFEDPLNDVEPILRPAFFLIASILRPTSPTAQWVRFRWESIYTHLKARQNRGSAPLGAIFNTSMAFEAGGPLAILSFELAYDWREADPQQGGALGHWVACAEPLIDGVRIRPHGVGDIFDAMQVMSAGLDGGDFDIYTCSCGVAGCAGIDEPCSVEVGCGEVRWVFPVDPFRKRLSKEVFPEGSPLEFVFDMGQYGEALHDLAKQVEQERIARGQPVLLSPCDRPSVEALELSVPELVALRKQRELAWAARGEMELAARELDEWVVHAMLPGGQIMSATLRAIAKAFVPVVEGVDDAGRDARRLGRLSAAVVKDPERAVGRLGFAAAQDIFCMQDWEEPEMDAGEFESAWEHARIKAVKAHHCFCDLRGSWF